ncbi:MAG: S41 family peptidase [Chloroflexota bacterium]
MSLIRRSFGLGLLIGAGLVGIFAAGLVAGVAINRHQNAALTNDAHVQDFLTAYQLVTKRSYYRPFNRTQLVDAAINGMLSETGDPHTLYFSPPQNRIANHELNGTSFSGIGAIVMPQSHYLNVLAPLPGSPALRAGIKPGDRIVAINGRDIRKIDPEAAVSLIHGPNGSRVLLTVTDPAGRARKVSLKRADIPPTTAYSRPLAHHIGYIRILSFGESTNKDVSEALGLLRPDHIRGLVLDLRGNPGGYVTAAQEVVSHFLNKGVVAYEETRSKHFTAINTVKETPHSAVPIAILVNGQTASAAEITAAALRDHHRASLVGTHTYGKGSMQSTYSLSDGASLRITDRLWLTPDHRSVHPGGLRPNIKVQQVTDRSGDAQLRAAETYLARRGA